MQEDSLRKDLAQLAALLRKYGHHGQATVVEQIITTLETASPDYKRLAGIDMWGGSGAVWEVCLTPSKESSTSQADEKLFHESIIHIAAAMEGLGIGTERSRSIAKIFRGWLDKGIV